MIFGRKNQWRRDSLTGHEGGGETGKLRYREVNHLSQGWIGWGVSQAPPQTC